MARLTALPSLEIIRGLKGIIDFYLWKGLPCARAWPRWHPARQSEASKAAALFFGAVVKSYSLLGELPLAAYRQDAAAQPRSARDVFVSGIYGNLHEADVSDFLGLLIECRDFLSALTAILNALQSNDTDQLVANVALSALPTGAATEATLATLSTEAKLETLRVLLASLDAKDFATDAGLAALFAELQLKADLTETQPISAAALPLPAGAATAAAQATQLTALAKIDDLQDALQSKALDRLLVRGQDQLFTYKDTLLDDKAAPISGEAGYIESSPVPADEVWTVTSISTTNASRTTTTHDFYLWRQDFIYLFAQNKGDFPAEQPSFCYHPLPLGPTDTIRVYFPEGLVNDYCYLTLTGLTMTKET